MMTTDSTAGRQKWQLWATAGILVAFATVAVYMLDAAHDNTSEAWQRRLYVFAGVQAIAYTAVGWLFGREVNSEALKAANAFSDSAKAEAREARGAVAISEKRASEAGIALADAKSKERAVRAAVAALASSDAVAQTGPRDVSSRPLDAAGVDRIQTLLREIYGD